MLTREEQGILEDSAGDGGLFARQSRGSRASSCLLVDVVTALEVETGRLDSDMVD